MKVLKWYFGISVLVGGVKSILAIKAKPEEAKELTEGVTQRIDAPKILRGCTVGMYWILAALITGMEWPANLATHIAAHIMDSFVCIGKHIGRSESL